MKGINIDINAQVPVYKQLISSIKNLVDSATIHDEEFLPSMNELSKELQISRETVKKAYNILRDQGVINSVHGKGFYVTKSKNRTIKILLVFDILSPYKQVLHQSFINHINNAEITIRLHNQDVNLFEQFVNDNLDEFDYYGITPHFPLSAEIQKKVIKCLERIPNRKLLLLDRTIDSLKGNYGAVYQDFENDIYKGLTIILEELKKYNKLNILSMPSSLYAPLIKKGIQKFCNKHSINFEIFDQIKRDQVKKKHAFIILNSQHDKELLELVRLTKLKGYTIGQDVGIISYNESSINEIILNGLSVFSTDFEQMGTKAAQMVMSKSFSKIKCDFKFIKRKTF